MQEAPSLRTSSLPYDAGRPLLCDSDCNHVRIVTAGAIMQDIVGGGGEYEKSDKEGDQVRQSAAYCMAVFHLSGPRIPTPGASAGVFLPMPRWVLKRL